MESRPPSHSQPRALAQTAAEVVANLVPYVGGSTAAVLHAALNYRLHGRRERWFAELAELVEVLESRLDGFDPETLAENEAFVDAVVTATRIVDRTSQHEKLDALRNAVLNCALPGAPDHDIQQLYLTLIDDLTPTHLRLLAMLHNPSGWPPPHPDRTLTPVILVRATMPVLSSQPEEIIERFHADLAGSGLVDASPSRLKPPRTGATTKYAEGFLAFIRDPAPAVSPGE